MAHKQVNGRVVVDWETGDLEGDRKNLMTAYRDFIKELQQCLMQPVGIDITNDIHEVFDKWKIDTKNQVDDFPRIWITRPT
jgi:hypothetical protein